MATRTAWAAAAVVLGSVVTGAAAQEAPTAAGAEETAAVAAELPAKAVEPSTIQIAILLDTSNSMDGLIEQAKAHLWSVVNEFATTKRDGVVPALEVALFEYGNDGLPASDGHIRLVQPLTTDLDAVSAGLFGLRTNGGNEHCGQVIGRAVETLKWGSDGQAYRAIFIAGNEPFTQGPVDYEEACRDAIAHGILVNTIHCGGAEEGADGKWKHAAQLADGAYLTINQDEALVHVEAPQDAELARLNTELNTTYLWYGAAAEEARANQEEQDANAGGVSRSVLSQRVTAKASSVYRNTGADLVDAVDQKQVDLATLEPDALPEPMRAMSPEERAKHVEEQSARRGQLQRQIAELSRERGEYLTQQRAQQPGNTLGDAMVTAVREQVREAGYEPAAPPQ